VSALKPEIGDRYRLGDDEWQVVAFEAGFKAHGPRSDHRARLARVDGGRGAKRAKLEDLLVGSWVYLGNFLPPPGFKAIKVGAHWYFKTPAGNVHGAPAEVGDWGAALDEGPSLFLEDKQVWLGPAAESAFLDGYSPASGGIYRSIWDQVDNIRAGYVGFTMFKHLPLNTAPC
jgi:hypothetical protein